MTALRLPDSLVGQLKAYARAIGQEDIGLVVSEALELYFTLYEYHRGGFTRFVAQNLNEKLEKEFQVSSF